MAESRHAPTGMTAAMAELMRRQGYGATSLKHLVEASGAPIGSVYHSFPGGKRQIAAEALRSSGAAYIGLLPAIVDGYDDLAAGLRAFFVAAAEDMENTGWATMCPVVTVGAEVAEVEPELRDVCADVVAGWIDQATHYFVRREIEPTDARFLTLAALAALEGAFSIARITRSPEALHTAADLMADAVRRRSSVRQASSSST